MKTAILCHRLPFHWTGNVAVFCCIFFSLPIVRGQNSVLSSAGVSYFVGLWQKRDISTQRVIAIVEFRESGESEERDNTVSGQRSVLRHYQFKPETSELEFSNTFGQGAGSLSANTVVSERGKVDLVSKELFKYRQDYGGTMYGFQGRTYEFTRESRTETATNVADIVGTWKRIDIGPAAAGNTANRTVTLKSDGTYQDTNHPDIGGPRYGEYRYQYENGILKLLYVRPNGEELLYESGRVDWMGQDKFTFLPLEGIDSRSGNHSEFARIEDKPSEPMVNQKSDMHLGSGLEEDFVGTWAGFDARGKQTAVVQLNQDGTCQTSGGQIVATNYEFKNRVLAFLIPQAIQRTAARQFVVTMQGTVNWISGSSFKYSIDLQQPYSGFQSRNRVIDFFRQSGNEGEDFVPYLVGNWECDDPATGRPVGTIQLDSDATFHAERIFATGTDRSAYRYKCEKRILSFLWVDANLHEWLIMRGRVDWIDHNAFHLNVLDGTNAANAPPQGYNFRRQ